MEKGFSWHIVVRPAAALLVRALLAGALTGAALAGMLPQEAADACLAGLLAVAGQSGL